MTECFIFDAVRTPRSRSRADGAFAQVKPWELAACVLRAIPQRLSFPAEQIDDVVFGIVEPVQEQGGDLPRIAALMAGYSQNVPGVQINRFCASGLEAVNLAAARIMAGQDDAVIAGGVESMTRVPMGSGGWVWSDDAVVAAHTGFIPQGISADLIASLHGFSREDVDGFALRSQQRAGHAQNQGYFSRSLVPVLGANGEILLAQDNAPRATTTAEGLASLKPVFAELAQSEPYASRLQQRYPDVTVTPVHTAGNSSVIVDGAAAVLLGNHAFAERYGLKPRARIRSFCAVGSEPTIMLTAPYPAALKAVGRAGLTMAEMDLFEINEAFAAVVLLFLQQSGVSPDKVNITGGAIALGHPLGATGAMLVGNLVDSLEREDKQFGLVSICVGAGMGVATVIERL